MEALWILPLYFICPLIGIILIIIGILKIKNGNSKKPFFIGLILLSLPFIHLLLISIFHWELENKIAGKYRTENEKNILTINNNGTFNLKNSSKYNNSGTGIWEIEEIDFPILKLDFKSKTKADLWLEIKNNEENITLSSLSCENEISTEFVKE